MAKKKTKIEDVNALKSEMLLHIICEACNKAALSGHDIICVLLACMTDVSYNTLSVESTDENFEKIAEHIKKEFLAGLKHYREMEEKENVNEN